MISLSSLLQQAADLPSFPAVALRVARETEHSDACAASIAELLAGDQGLSSRVLRLANSSFFGVPRRIDSLREAIIILGLVNVRRLALAASTYSWFMSASRGNKLPMALWSQGLGMATIAGKLETYSPHKSGTDLFTAGIVADIGLAAMGAVEPDGIARMFQLCRDELMPLARAEQEVFGFSHEQVGGELATEWGFPIEIVECIRYHHWPHRSPAGSAAPYFLHVSLGLLSETGQGLATLGVVETVSSDGLAFLGIEPDDLTRLRTDLADASQRQNHEIWGFAA